MNHIEAFLSDDAKRGRVWTDSDGEYMRRANGDYMHRVDKHDEWCALRQQVAAMEGTVTWADEPKTLTPQEALRALADGKCVQSSRFIYRLVDREICAFNPGRTPVWFPTTYFYRECHVVPDPSQPAEPQVEYPLLYGEALGAMHHEGRIIESEASKEEYRIDSDGRLTSSSRIYRDWSRCIGFAFSDAEVCGKWRIVDGGK